MAIELGHFALILGFAIAAASALAGLWGWNRSERVALFLRQGAVLQFLLVAAAFAALIQAFVTSDFSLAIAFQHSHSAQPLLFKITSVWGNHEGSMVLWVLILVGMGAAVAMFGGNLPRDLLALAHVAAGLFALQLLPRAADREALLIQQAADLADHDDILALVVAAIAATLDGLELREFLLPVAQHMRLHAAQLAHLTDSEVAFARDGGEFAVIACFQHMPRLELSAFVRVGMSLHDGR